MNGNWITFPNESRRKNLYFRSRKNFDLGEANAPARLSVAAESYYMLWVNGAMVGRGPARGSRSVNFFDTHDVSHLLRPGSNWIAVLVQCMNVPNYNTFPVAAAVIADLEGIISSGSDWEVCLNDEWVEDVEIYTGQTGFCEYRDLRKTPLGWRMGLDDATWVNAEVIDEDVIGKELKPRDIPFLQSRMFSPVDIAGTAVIVSKPNVPDREIARAMDEAERMDVNGELSVQCVDLLAAGERSVRIDPPPEGDGISIIFDFRREIIGFFELELTAPAGVVVELCHDEALFKGRLIAHRCGYRFADRVITRNGRQTVGNTLNERGFRLTEVILKNFNEPITLRVARAVDRRYPFIRRGDFFCGEMGLNRIWDVSAETVSACVTDVFNDCPWRERAFWTNDMMVEGIVSLQAFGDYRLNAHALRLAMSNRRADGWLPATCPDRGEERNVIVPNNLLFTLALRDYFLYSGDEELTRELLPGALEMLGLFDSLKDADHVIAPASGMWMFLDWSYEANGIQLDKGASASLNWLYCAAANAAAMLLDSLGDHETARTWRDKIPPVVAGIETRFWSDSRNAYLEFGAETDAPVVHTQLSHAFALTSRFLPESRRSAAVAALNDPAAIEPELYMSHFVLNQLGASGKHDEAMTRIRRRWLKMVETGTPTLWEAGVYSIYFASRSSESAFSLCHGFSATPINYFQTTALGIRPLEPGFRIFAVAPHAHGLHFAKGSAPTPNGAIRVDWRIDDGEMVVKLRVPRGLTARTANGDLSSGDHEFTLNLENEDER